MSIRQLFAHAANTLLALAIATMIALAAGAAWMVAAAYLQRDPTWLAVPIGAVLGWTMRTSVTRSRRFAAGLAAAATALAALYMLCLRAGMQVAGMMGVSFADALRQAGAGMLFDIARQNLPPMYLALTCGLLVAVAVALRGKRR